MMISLLSLAPLLFSSLVSASFDCSFDLDSHHFNLNPLKGVHTTWKTSDTPPTVTNTTVFIDLCQTLHWNDELYDVNERCKEGTQVCVITYAQRDKEKNVLQVVPAAGEFPSLDANTSLLTSTDSDNDVEGVKVELHGDIYVDQKQTTVIELICDHSIDVGEPRFRSFKKGILRLDWRTKYACPSSANDPPSKDKDDPESSTPSTKHWGFLTWLIIIVFLVISAYVIYSAFLNYSRYGAGSGWDLLPHSDTLRDIPYLVRDFTNHVVSTVKGGSSRGGYSAV